MKTKMLFGWRWMTTVTGAVVLLGCLDESNKTSAQNTPATNAVIAGAPPADDSSAPLQAVIPPANLSPGIPELVKLAESGVGEDVLKAYVEKSGKNFNPSVDEIVYLKDLGIPETVLASLFRQGNPDAAREATPSVTSVPQNTTPAPAPNLPSLVPSDAPSYSVTADPGYTDAATTAPAQQVSVEYFDSALSPYGNWVEVADYGRCWQPTVVVINRNWRPYADSGRWIYSSAGWYWHSDYSWGWAPFHYGRWYCDNRAGWVWVPGSTWGPSWVSWRYTDSYCGWAPLPPSAHYVTGFGFSYNNSRVGINFDFGLRDDFYTFVPTSRFCDRNSSRYYESRAHSRTIYKNSVVINNYINGNNNTVINEGIGRDRVERASGRQVHVAALRDLPTASAGS
ncbi:MAG: DUF6600 domain-containing protein [Verrucomicrobiota bacterium]